MTESAVILAIETATSSCSVALSDGETSVSRTEVGSNIHSRVLLEMVRDVFAEMAIQINELQAVAVGQGPGSFTGLRIGVGVAQGLAYGAGCPMIGVSSLDALANQASEQGSVIAGIDARMGEVYWCEYLKTESGVVRQTELLVTPPASIKPIAETKTQLLGNAWSEYRDLLSDELLKLGVIDKEQIFPEAQSLLKLAQHAFENGELISPIDFAPEYVRNNVAKKSVKK